MKNYIFILLCFLTISCSKEKTEEPTPAYLTFVVNSKDVLAGDEHPYTSTVMLFDANNTEYAPSQSFADISNYTAVDVKGAKHPVSFVLIAHDGSLQSDTKPGRYLAVILLHSTNRYAFKYVDLKAGSNPSIAKLFLSLIPKCTAETW